MTPFSANSTYAQKARVCQRGASRKSPSAGCCALTDQKTRDLFSYCREGTPQPVQHLPSILAPDLRLAWYSCCSLVSGLSLYPHTPGCVRSYSLRVEGLAPYCFVCCLRLLVTHTYQVLLPNSPMHPQKCTQDAWLTGALKYMLYTFAMYFYFWCTLLC